MIEIYNNAIVDLLAPVDVPEDIKYPRRVGLWKRVGLGRGLGGGPSRSTKSTLMRCIEGRCGVSTYDLRTRRDGSIEVTNVQESPVTTVHDALHQIDKAFQQRAVAATDLNAHSSRSHWSV